jgi:hypothetical protein
MKFINSKNDNLVQLADMVADCIYATLNYKSDSKEYLDVVHKHI